MCGVETTKSTRSEERAATQRRRGANTAPTELKSTVWVKMATLDDTGENKAKKLEIQNIQNDVMNDMKRAKQKQPGKGPQNP